MKTSTCNCHSTAAAVADVCEGALELPRYFPRQLLTPAEMTLEQQYFRMRLRRHNRFLHGWGVVCGAEVCRVPEANGTGGPPPKPQPWKVRVKPGYILGPQGDEILIDREQMVDLRTQGAIGSSDEPDDVWCTPILQERNDNQPATLFVAVRYKEMTTRPVRVQSAGCGCDDTQCELSRLRDGYQIGFLTECPESHQNPPKPEDLFAGPTPDCFECPTSSWVVLAKVEVDADGTITLIDNCSCRRVALSASGLWRQCTEILKVFPEILFVDDSIDAEITVTRELPQTIQLNFGDPEITVGEVGIDGNLIRAQVGALPDAVPGPRTLTILDSIGRVLAEKKNALTVVLGQRPKPPEAPMPTSLVVYEQPKPPQRKKRSAKK